MTKIKKIAILTSGGDSPGMNNAVRSVILTAIKNNITPYIVYEGFLGLTNGNFKEITSKEDLNSFISKGGTFIHSARFPEFKKVEVRQKAVDKMSELGIQALVVIGGDGSYMGAAKLKEMGIQTIALPGTIDNDIALTDYTIGFYTAQDSITKMIDQIRDTAESHNRAIVVEVMGRYCGDLAITSALATGAEVLSIPERKIDKQEIIEQVKTYRKNGKRSIIVVVTEHMFDVHELAKDIQEQTGVESRGTVLGYLQRGGTPVAQDRILATRMGVFAIKKLLAGETGVAIGIKDNQLVTDDIYKVIKSKGGSIEELLEQYNLAK